MPTVSDGRRRSLRWLGAAGAVAALPAPELVRDGIGGRCLELVAGGDSDESTMALGNTTDLIEGDKVFARVCYVGAESVHRSLPLAGLDTGGLALRQHAQRRQATSQAVLTELDVRGRPRA